MGLLNIFLRREGLQDPWSHLHPIPVWETAYLSGPETYVDSPMYDQAGLPLLLWRKRHRGLTGFPSPPLKTGMGRGEGVRAPQWTQFLLITANSRNPAQWTCHHSLQTLVVCWMLIIQTCCILPWAHTPTHTPTRLPSPGPAPLTSQGPYCLHSVHSSLCLCPSLLAGIPSCQLGRALFVFLKHIYC
jgi:hypothetical protein